MSNPFYTASGNPATGSEGLSALIRTEFLSISAAFDMMPRLTTTGLFDTVFNQIGSYTFTLPSAPGTFATLAGTESFSNKTLVSPALTGTPTAPTATAGTNTTQLATTAFAAAAVLVETTRATTAEALLAPKASPALTGTPTAPTAAAGTNTTQLATTAFNAAAVLVETTRATGAEGVLTAAVSTETSRATTAEALLAPKASPALTGTPTAPTAAAGTNTTQLATTAYSTAAILVETNRATTAEGTLTTAVGTETTRATTAEALLAPKASPTLTGVPAAPTAAPGTNTTQLATTAYATAADLVETNRATAAEALLAPKASPTFTGTVSGAAASFSGAVAVNTFSAAAGGNSIGFTANTGLFLNQTGPTAGNGILISLPIVTSNFVVFATNTGSTIIGSITPNGAGTAVLYNTTSDYRLKTLHGPADGSILSGLPIYDGCFNAAPDHRMPMAVAHEIAEVAPWAVTGAKDAVDADGEPVMQQVDYSALVPALIAYVQSLEKRLAMLEGR